MPFFNSFIAGQAGNRRTGPPALKIPGPYLTFFSISFTISLFERMEQRARKEEIFFNARGQHVMLERRLRVLMDRPYLTGDEEMEMKKIKKQKLFFKDLMEAIREENEEGGGQ
jgi:hypothetical protein